MEHPPGDTPRPSRRGPSVDIDRNGVAAGKRPDRRPPHVNKLKGAGEVVGLPARAGTCSSTLHERLARGTACRRTRQVMMHERIAASASFKGVHLTTSYDDGIDDRDLVVALDSDYSQKFVDLVGTSGLRRRACAPARHGPCSCARRRGSRQSRRSWRPRTTTCARVARTVRSVVQSAHFTARAFRIVDR